MLELLSHGFMQKAFMAGILISASTSLIGVYLILRKLSMLGSGLAHASFGGVAIGFLTGLNPFLTALIFAAISSLGINKLVEEAKTYGDSAIAVILSLGMATAVLIIGYVDGFGASLFSYLFGSILSISQQDLMVMTMVFMAISGFIYKYYSQLMMTTFNHEFAKVQGIRTKKIEAAFTVLVALSVVVSIRAVGILLVTSLLVIPGLAALQISASFKSTLLNSVVISEVSMIAGIYLSYLLDLPPAGVIVTLMMVALAGAIIYTKIKTQNNTLLVKNFSFN